MLLYADECVFPKQFKLLAALLNERKPPISCVHLLDELKSGTTDKELAEKLASMNPRPVVLSGDTGKQSGRHDPRLPLLLPELGITGVFFSPTSQQRTGFEKIRGLLICLPQIVAFSEDHDGQGKRLRLIIEKDEGHCRVEEWPLAKGKQLAIKHNPHLGTNL